MVCNQTCLKYKAKLENGVGGVHYALGHKRCQVCSLFINWDGLWCPCCGNRLRTKPRNKKYKQKLRETKGLATYE